jgi:putative transcriptional regulator
MFSENLKNIRKQKGLSQEELAERLHVVRQTISKWEKGLSVPDASFLIRIAEILETSVSTLLGDTVEPPENKNILAQKLEQLNALLAERNRRSRRIWKTVAIILISMAALTVLLIIVSIIGYHSYSGSPAFTTEETEQTVVP